MIHLSDKQEAMLAFIEGFVDQNGYPPTYEEIKQGLNISTKSLVDYHLDVLENAACITRVPNTPRGIRLKNEGTSPIGAMPVDNSHLPALSNEEIVELTYDIVTNDNNLYALKVQEDAANNDAFVQAGDIVILQRQRRVDNGEMAAVRLLKEGLTTIKRYYRENGHVRLQAVKENLTPLILKPEAVEIQGKVLAVIRQADHKVRQYHAIR
jgi:repressor LexA